MIKKMLVSAALSAAVAINMTGAAWADKDDNATKADNTRVNKEMRANKEMTADQQGQSEADRKITQEIRQAIVKDKSLSTYAHNVKVITRGGEVRLRGPVRSAREKSAVGKAAARVAGKERVNNELEVTTSTSK